MSRVRWEVKPEPCADHPDKEWLTLSVGGATLMAICTGGLEALARLCRGRELLQLECRDYDHRCGVSMRVRERPCGHHESEWLTLYEDGVVLLSCCITALEGIARLNRGEDLVALLGPRDPLSDNVRNGLLLAQMQSAFPPGDEEPATNNQ